MNDASAVVDQAAAVIKRRAGIADAIGARGRFEVVCRDAHGREKWRDTIENLVVNAGLNYLLDTGLSGATQITSWFVGLTAGSPSPAAADTMASHGGWTEVTAYDEANRQAWSEGGAASQSITNSGSPAVFTVNANGTVIGGLFLTSNNTKGGSTGTLYGVGALSGGNKTLDDNETITCTYATSLSSS